MWGLYVILSTVFIVGGVGLTAHDIAEQNRMAAQENNQAPTVEVQQIQQEPPVNMEILP